MTYPPDQKVSTRMPNHHPLVENDAVNLCHRCGSHDLMGFEMHDALTCVYCITKHPVSVNALPVLVQPVRERQTCVVRWQMDLEIAHALAGNPVARLAADHLASILIERGA